MKNWIFTPAFCKAEMMYDFLDSVRYLPKDFIHVIIDDHYPIKREVTSLRIQALAKSHDRLYIRTPFNLGLHEALNFGMRAVGVNAEDFYVNCDADDRPSPGTFEAMKKVMQTDPTISVLATRFNGIEQKEFWKQEDKLIADLRVKYHPSIEMWNVSAINMKLLSEIGGQFAEPHAFYGGIEVDLKSRLKEKMKLAYLVDYGSNHRPIPQDYFDPSFREYKDAHVKGYKHNFETFLKERYPHLL